MDGLIKGHLDVLEKYIPGKAITQVQREYGLEKIVKLASNEWPYPPFDEALKAIECYQTSINRYPDEEVAALRAVLSEKLGVATENILIGNGSNELIRIAMEAIIGHGDEVAYCAPTFMLYQLTAKKFDGKVIEVPLNNHRFDLEVLLKAITDKTKLVIICNPNNPTGTIVSQEELDWFMEEVDKKDCLVLIDQAYQEFVDDSNYPDTVKYLKEGKAVMATGTFSKIYGLAGLRIGYGIAPKVLVHIDRKLRDPFNINTLAQAAALASLGAGEELLKRKKLNAENRQLLYDGLDDLGVDYVPSQANFVLINAKKDSNIVFKDLLAKGVITRTGDIFGQQYQNYLRITVGTREELEMFLKALKDVL
ncbi:MAG: histidinol-phosphate transaminase [Actinobacteria bacterium]|nr:MAG: histidinol-phosphate transaminase [Actinomycetota bacterium]